MATVFCGELGNLLAATQPQPVVPGFAQTVPRREISLVELVALNDLSENSLHRKIAGVQDCVSCADSRGVVRVARSNHRQTANLRVLKRITIITTQSRRSVENLDGVDR